MLEFKRTRSIIDMEVTFKDVDVDILGTQILHDISGMASCGELLAVMGPSGAGKSTLLNVISGRMTCSSGTVLLNKRPLTHGMRRQICYVPQRDEFFANLTLKQTLTFAALLRLPEKMPNHLKVKRVEEIIDLLDLRKCADTVMGGLFLPGLSGGERKRASIGCEIITNPSLIMLDEPTSGLDSAIAYSLMRQLKQYTQHANKTVIASIHQPSSQIFHMFDNILLLAEGHVAYFGPCSKMVDFFSSLSLYCYPNWNFADFILEKVKEGDKLLQHIITAADARRYESDWPIELKPEYPLADGNDLPDVKFLIEHDQPRPGNTSVPVKQPRNPTEESATTHLLEKSLNEQNGDVSSVVDDKTDGIATAVIDEYYVEGAKWQTGFLLQYTTLTQRSFCQAKSRILSKLNIIQTFVLAFACGFLWFQTPRSEDTVSDRNGLIFFLVAYLGFFSMFDVITSFPEERGILTLERSAGIYRLSAHFFSKMTSEAPLMFVLPVVMVTIAYWMGGLTASAASFCAVLFIILLHAIVAQSFGIVIGVTFMDFKTSITFASTFMLSILLAGGFYQTNFPVWMSWAPYLSYLHYTFHAVVMIEYTMGPNITCSVKKQSMFPDCSWNMTSSVTGTEYLKFVDIYHPVYVDVLVLIGLAIFLRLLGYIILRYSRRSGHHRRK